MACVPEGRKGHVKVNARVQQDNFTAGVKIVQCRMLPVTSGVKRGRRRYSGRGVINFVRRHAVVFTILSSTVKNLKSQ